MRFFVLLSLSIAIASAADTAPPKSACTERNHGKFWPPEANRDRAVAQKRFSDGELWMCEGNYDWDAYFPATLHFFTWKRVSVRFKAKPSAEAGEAQADLRDAETLDAH
jgi:hypothetical protein